MSRKSSFTPPWLALLVCAAASVVPAATTDYKYDSLGRLREVTHANGVVTKYDLDAAGNRKQVDEILNQSPPASITVPATSTSGNYSVTWTAGGTVTSYELFESTTSNFATQTRVFAGAGTTASLSGHGNGSYYYRVRGCVGSACTAYRTGSNATVVTVAPGVPSSITVPTSSANGTFTVSWGTANGQLTRYELWEATNSSFSGEARVYNSSGTSTVLTGRTNGTFYYRVRACNGNACGSFRTAVNAVTDATAPNAPAWITVPTSAIGQYTISWAAVSSPVAVTNYHVQESGTANFSSGSWEITNSLVTSFLLNNSTSGTFYYRVRACNGGACSAFTYTANGIINVPAPSAPGTMTVPATNTSGNVGVSWVASTGTVTRYEWFVANNASFSGQIALTPGTATNVWDLGRTSGTWYYRVRACNQEQCSGYTAGGNPVVISNPYPDKPTGLSYFQAGMCGWTANWNAMPGATYYSFRDQSGNHASSPTTNTVSYSFCGDPDNPNNYKPKWVKACNANGCSIQTDFP